MDKEVEYLRVAEVAERMHASEQTVYRWIKSGLLRAKLIGGTYRIPESALASLPDAIKHEKEPC